MTVPVDDRDDGYQATIVQASYQDETTKALWLHKDLVQVRPDWDIEAHVGPIKAAEVFGDVESWGAYVKAYGTPVPPYLTWNSKGLRAVLDYHLTVPEGGATGRCQWTATYPFTPSVELVAWQRLASGTAHGQKAVIEALEDRADDIVEPSAADLLAILRNLRANVSSTATTELDPDGSVNVSFQQAKVVQGTNKVSLPATFAIAIPVLQGHPTRYALTVRVRPSVDDAAHLTFRFSLPNVERALEDVYAERVGEAKEGLGDGFTILRAAG